MDMQGASECNLSRTTLFAEKSSSRDSSYKFMDWLAHYDFNH